MSINYRDIVHPEDEKAMQQLQKTPGIKFIAEKIVNMGYERYYRNLYMADHVKLGPNQLPEIYNLLPPIAEKFGIDAPELYIEQSPILNAMTIGDKTPLIVINSGLIAALSKDELASVIAHECGHILCRHCLYKTILTILQRLVSMGSIGLGLDTLLAKPVILAALYASCYWSRRAEYSADRASLVYTEDIKLTHSSLLRLSAGPFDISKDINLESFAEQTQMQDAQVSSNMWDKIIYTLLISERTHPFATTRLAELDSWNKSEQYQIVINKLRTVSEQPMLNKCPSCGNEIDETCKFCKFCGYQIK